jgi:hypothetical protein
VRVTADLPSQGLCDDETKTIHLQYVPEDEDDLHFLLIHEICHAVTVSGHTKRWLERLSKAAQRAKRTGRHRLEQMLHKEVDQYIHETFTIDANCVYGDIRDCVSEHPKANYEEVLAMVTRDSGFYPQDLEKHYVRCRRVYDEEKELQFAREYYVRYGRVYKKNRNEAIPRHKKKSKT